MSCYTASENNTTAEEVEEEDFVKLFGNVQDEAAALSQEVIDEKFTIHSGSRKLGGLNDIYSKKRPIPSSGTVVGAEWNAVQKFLPDIVCYYNMCDNIDRPESMSAQILDTFDHYLSADLIIIKPTRRRIVKVANPSKVFANDIDDNNMEVFMTAEQEAFLKIMRTMCTTYEKTYGSGGGGASYADRFKKDDAISKFTAGAGSGLKHVPQSEKIISTDNAPLEAFHLYVETTEYFTIPRYLALCLYGPDIILPHRAHHDASECSGDAVIVKPPAPLLPSVSVLPVKVSPDVPLKQQPWWNSFASPKKSTSSTTSPITNNNSAKKSSTSAPSPTKPFNAPLKSIKFSMNIRKRLVDIFAIFNAEGTTLDIRPQSQSISAWRERTLLIETEKKRLKDEVAIAKKSASSASLKKRKSPDYSFSPAGDKIIDANAEREKLISKRMEDEKRRMKEIVGVNGKGIKNMEEEPWPLPVRIIDIKKKPIPWRPTTPTPPQQQSHSKIKTEQQTSEEDNNSTSNNVTIPITYSSSTNPPSSDLNVEERLLFDTLSSPFEAPHACMLTRPLRLNGSLRKLPVDQLPIIAGVVGQWRNSTNSFRGGASCSCRFKNASLPGCTVCLPCASGKTVISLTSWLWALRPDFDEYFIPPQQRESVTPPVPPAPSKSKIVTTITIDDDDDDGIATSVSSKSETSIVSSSSSCTKMKFKKEGGVFVEQDDDDDNDSKMDIDSYSMEMLPFSKSLLSSRKLSHTISSTTNNNSKSSIQSNSKNNVCGGGGSDIVPIECRDDLRIQQVKYRTGRCVYLVHTIDLIKQTETNIRKYVPDARIGILRQSSRPDPRNIDILIVSTDTLACQSIDPEYFSKYFLFLISDETHQNKAVFFNQAYRKLNIWNSVSFTATPRHDRLPDMFGPILVYKNRKYTPQQVKMISYAAGKEQVRSIGGGGGDKSNSSTGTTSAAPDRTTMVSDLVIDPERNKWLCLLSVKALVTGIETHKDAAITSAGSSNNEMVESNGDQKTILNDDAMFGALIDDYESSLVSTSNSNYSKTNDDEISLFNSNNSDGVEGDASGDKLRQRCRLIFYKNGGLSASMVGAHTNLPDGDIHFSVSSYSSFPPPRFRRPSLTTSQRREIKHRQKAEMDKVIALQKREQQLTAVAKVQTPGDKLMAASGMTEVFQNSDPKVWTKKPVQRIITDDKLYVHHFYDKFPRKSIFFSESIQHLILQQHMQAQAWIDTCTSIPRQYLCIIRTNVKELSVVDVRCLKPEHVERIKWLGTNRFDIKHRDRGVDSFINAAAPLPSSPSSFLNEKNGQFVLSPTFMFTPSSKTSNSSPLRVHYPEKMMEIPEWCSGMNVGSDYSLQCDATLNSILQFPLFSVFPYFSSAFFSCWFEQYPCNAKHAVEFKTSLQADGPLQKKKKHYEKLNLQRSLQKCGNDNAAKERILMKAAAVAEAAASLKSRNAAQSKSGVESNYFSSSSSSLNVKIISPDQLSSGTISRASGSTIQKEETAATAAVIFDNPSDWSADGMDPSNWMHISQYYWTPIYGPFPPILKAGRRKAVPKKNKSSSTKKIDASSSSSSKMNIDGENYETRATENDNSIEWLVEHFMTTFIAEIDDDECVPGTSSKDILKNEVLDQSVRPSEKLPGVLATFGLLVGTSHEVPKQIYDCGFFAPNNSFASSSATLSDASDSEEDEGELDDSSAKKKNKKKDKKAAIAPVISKSSTSIKKFCPSKLPEQTVAKESDYMFATYAIASTGIDKETLDTVIEGSVRNDNEQSRGRGQRYLEGKQDGLVISFVEPWCSMYSNAAMVHQRAYISEGATIEYYRIEKEEKQCM